MIFNEDAQVCKFNLRKYFWYGARRYKRKKKLKYLLLTYVQYITRIIWGSIDRFSYLFFPSFSEIIQFFYLVIYLFIKLFFTTVPVVRLNYTFPEIITISLPHTSWYDLPEPVKHLWWTKSRVVLIFMHTILEWL